MAKPPHPRSYYAASAHPSPELPELEQSLACDVAVVGGGYTGLTAALELASRGYDVVLLEAARVGFGASGRNGGHVAWGYAAEMEAIERAVGREDAGRLWALGLEAVELLRERVRRLAIDCDLKLTGYLLAAPKARQMRALEKTARHLEQRYGYAGGRLLRREELHAVVRSPRYLGGYWFAEAGHLHPLNYALGLARAAQAAGARLFEGSRVRAIKQGAAVLLQTKRGSVRARFAVLAGNATLGRLVPELCAQAMPASTYMVATEPLGEARARALIPGDIAISDCNFVLDYFRLSADGRLLFGGGVSYSTVTPPDLRATMRRKILRVFPQLSNARLDYAWHGRVAITMERTPALGRLAPNLYYAHGYSGHGVALTGLAGRVIAEAIAGQAERFDVFARLPHRRFPGGPLLRMPLLVLGMAYYRLRDLL